MHGGNGLHFPRQKESVLEALTVIAASSEYRKPHGEAFGGCKPGRTIVTEQLTYRSNDCQITRAAHTALRGLQHNIILNRKPISIIIIRLRGSTC